MQAAHIIEGNAAPAKPLILASELLVRKYGFYSTEAMCARVEELYAPPGQPVEYTADIGALLAAPDPVPPPQWTTPDWKPPTMRERIVCKVAEMAAWAVSLRRRLVYLELPEDECEQLGLPYGSTERALYLFPLSNARWWRLGLYLRRDEAAKDEVCIDLRLLGFSAEVWFVPSR